MVQDALALDILIEPVAHRGGLPREGLVGDLHDALVAGDQS